MKTIVSTLFTVSCVLAVSLTKVSAQESSYAVPASNNSNYSSTTSSTTAAPAGVSTKAFNLFNQKFSNATEVRWNSNSNTTSVNFKQNGIATRSTFDTKGNLEYTIRNYYGAQVPKNIVNIVRRNGYGMKILHDVEVTRRNVTSHFVKMEDETSVTTVQIHADGEVTVYETFTKG
jgi:hypothetical protein